VSVQINVRRKDKETDMKLAGEVAIITGAGSGIGRSIALEFAKEGADIVVVYRKNDVNAEESARLIRNLGRKVIVLKTDVSNGQAVASLFEAVARAFGCMDILVNNAGVFLSGSVFELPEHSWDQVLDVDLKGAFLCTQAFARYLKGAAKPGKVINIGSVQGTRPWKNASNYAAAKAGLVNLTKAMALELAAYGITVNVVSPGAIAAGPNAARTDDSEFMSRVEREIPLRRMGEAREVAKLVVYLASKESDYITGTEIVIDGGLLLHPFSV
jgi:NAD(P)-dependent dehydrogenase (short-subunit alcohol dehydrogenase family)